ncbi:MAG: hypothetical protein K2H64_09535 [Desulfovibrio sp.]|nr:hypothetical protein [Desulfovibrio sp.]
MANQDYDTLIAFLTDKHGKIIEAERIAYEKLKGGDKDEYLKKMREKAMILADLSRECEPALANLPPDKREKISEETKRFSVSAATALNLDSSFYMAALLYRDNHKDGEPDNLYVFIEDLKNDKI